MAFSDHRLHDQGNSQHLDVPTDVEAVVETYSRKGSSTPDEENTDASFEVRFEEGDSENPKNWPRGQRWAMTTLGAILVFNGTFASTAISGIVPDLQEAFGISREVVSVMIALFVAGYMVGPLGWGPLSEHMGRRPIFIASFLFYTGFQVGCALSRNTASMIVFRFLSGAFSAGPLTNSGGMISDIWDAGTRGKGMAVFTLAPFAGPSLGPLVCGYMAVAGVSWRWVFWLQAIIAGVSLLAILVMLPETYAPVLLKKRAQRKRRETGDSRWFAPAEKIHMTFIQRVQYIIAKPFQVLFLEPMLMACTALMSFLYGCTYLLFEAYPIVFTAGHNFNAGVSGLMYLPYLVGGTVGVISYLAIFNPRYERLMKKFSPNPVPPEYRMEMGLYAAPMYAVAFFWFGWTSYPEVSYWAPMTAGFPMGWATIWLLLALYNYVVDTYVFVAASALAAMTVTRSIFGATFPLFSTQMYDTLNPRWASTLVGCFAALLAPIPWLLMRYGPELRRRSRFSPVEGLPEQPLLEKIDDGEVSAEGIAGIA